jgi:hypothetical protein
VVFDRTLAEREALHDRNIIATPIDQHYLQEFKARFAKAFQEHAVLRRLFANFGAYQERLLSQDSMRQRWGLSQIDLKEAYIAEGHSKYFDWPEQYARNLATSESDYAFHRILECLPQCDLGDVHGVAAKLERIGEEVKASDIRPTIALVARQGPLGVVDRVTSNFTPGWLVRRGGGHPRF